MRRRLVPLLSVFAILALGAWSGSAGAIVCPASAASARVGEPPCCGPPIVASDVAPGCCPSSCCASTCCPGACCASGGTQSACPVTQLSIASSPNPSTAGQKVTISGRLLNGSSGTTVSLWQKLPGQSTFTRVAQTATNSAGDYSIVRGAGTVLTNATWYASTGTSSGTSPSVVQRVSAQVKLGGWWMGGRLLILGGQVSPSHRGERIALQRRTANGWRTIATTVIGRLSRFTVRHRFAHKGKVTVRAVFAGDPRNIRSPSAPLRLSIR
jgi:hypothetical protein